MRERAPEKAVRLLRDGKVRIVEVRPDLVKAVVVGDHGIYSVHRFEGRWYCDCPALGPCSHAMAASRVVG
jgi:uncharacterized Zn finger protein